MSNAHQRYCWCSRSEGRTFIGEWASDGKSLICSTCHKPLPDEFYPEEIRETSAPGDPRTLEEIKKDLGSMARSDATLIPMMAYECDVCCEHSWMFDHDQGQKGADDIVQCSLDEGFVTCPLCDNKTKIPPEWEVMFK